MRLPDFIIVGAMKAGTTTLAHYLRQHSEIYIPEEELHFFDARGRFADRWGLGLEWYAKQFEDADPLELCGEKTPTYSYLPSVPKRIHRLVPDVKIIWMLRNPIDRSYSNYWHEVQKGAEKISFEEAVRREDERVRENIWKGYVRRSQYIEQIDRFLNYFDQESMHFCFLKNLKEKPIYSINKITSFLDVSGEKINFRAIEKKKNITVLPYSISIRHHVRNLQKKIPLVGSMISKVERRLNRRSKPGYPEMRSSTRERLKHHFAPYNRRLEEKIGVDLSVWRD